LPSKPADKGSNNGQSFNPPMPTPVEGKPMPMSMYQPGYQWGPGQVMAAGYRPMYYPSPNMGYWPQMPQPGMPLMQGNPMAMRSGINAFTGGN
jgi:hypothetical protein